MGIEPRSSTLPLDQSAYCISNESLRKKFFFSGFNAATPQRMSLDPVNVDKLVYIQVSVLSTGEGHIFPTKFLSYEVMTVTLYYNSNS